MIGDLEGMDTTTAPGFDATPFRAKSLTVCFASAACIYYTQDNLGNKQSMEAYMDGAESTPGPVKLVLEVGAASQHGNPSVTFTATDYITLTFDGGKKVLAYLPAFTGTSLTLYIASDGSTFRDAALTMVARLRP
jgi:hypothetical protein